MSSGNLVFDEMVISMSLLLSVAVIFQSAGGVCEGMYFG